jgi:nicotinamide mononucleotide transporter
MSLVEVLGFVTGALCVWLLVKEHILNWPIGIANNILFAVLFWRTRLFGDMGLQFIFLALGLLGWYRWLVAGKDQAIAPILRTPLRSAVSLVLFLAAATPLLTIYLQSVRGSSPFLDALTTILSIVALYMQTRKYLEHWLVWIAADVVYIGLYIARDLRLTAVLYLIFLLMCIQGWRAWRTRLKLAVSVH